MAHSDAPRAAAGLTSLRNHPSPLPTVRYLPLERKCNSVASPLPNASPAHWQYYLAFFFVFVVVVVVVFYCWILSICLFVLCFFLFFFCLSIVIVYIVYFSKKTINCVMARCAPAHYVVQGARRDSPPLFVWGRLHWERARENGERTVVSRDFHNYVTGRPRRLATGKMAGARLFPSRRSMKRSL